MRNLIAALCLASLSACATMPAVAQSQMQCRPADIQAVIDQAKTENVIKGDRAKEITGDPDTIAVIILFHENEFLAVNVWRETDGTEGVCFGSVDGEMIRKWLGTGI